MWTLALLTLRRTGSDQVLDDRKSKNPMNYSLNKNKAGTEPKNPMLAAVKKLWPLMRGEKRTLIAAFLAILVNAGFTLVGPLIAAHVIDTYVPAKDYGGVLFYAAVLFGMYVIALVASYLQTLLMGGVGQRVLFNLRNALFLKLQALPVAFFNQNKAGDLISRINNDTDKLNQFFSQSLMQFLGSVFTMLGSGIFLIALDPRLGLVALIPGLFIVVFTRATSGWVKRKNAVSMRALGDMSAEIQESLGNFKTIIAFNRRDYFRERFDMANEENYKTSIGAGIANTIFTPAYGFAASIGQLIVLAYGIFLIAHGQCTIGLLIGFLIYVTNFYNPLRQLAALWANFQVALAGWDRISDILSLTSNLVIIPSGEVVSDAGENLLEFKGVSFRYDDGEDILRDANFILKKGKTYALVGPTGGGKTTTASLMARLYDPTAGTVFLNGRDIRSYDSPERAQKIGFILQEPFLFVGTVAENIVYGNEKYAKHSGEDLEDVIRKAHLGHLLARFDQGLNTKIGATGDSVSLGQKQLIAFIRAVLREPELLILDEATANIDTVTEQLLDDILKKLPQQTTRVIIAHRLNTIENADEIFFVNAGEIVRAGSMSHAVDMLMHGKRES
jgi:ATP-binding cassette subfamily B protein